MSWFLWLFLGLITILLLSFWGPPALRYPLKFTIFVLVSLCWAALPIPLMALRPRDPRNALLPAWGLRACARFLGLRYKLRGQDKVLGDSGKKTGCVVLINHQSALDLIVLAYLWPVMPRCTVISKKEVLWLGPFGLATWLWGTVFIDRTNKGGARAVVNGAGQAINDRGSRVLMFPEGTRHGGDELLPFKKGAFHLAIETQCDIQPVVASKYTFLDSKTHKFDSGKCTISILPPISTKGLTIADLDGLVTKVRDVMAAEYNILNAETLNLNNNTHHKQH